jgi:hypothetical protein
MALGDEIDEDFRREVKSLPHTRRRRLRVVPESHRRWTR